ncbi:uncharacterized protein TrAtP1_005116 [Trichoderma atroviride]|uniref:uncharacterized protein n=1 Tax=Hypocrea atroviridis TaxID=63577 RepID=UPI00331BBEC8|nr:hypothetical protein TrAtP1_005116 [Trichoderma atroviride]
MDGMDMSGDGMTGMGSDINHRFARAYWYITAVVVASLMAVRGINHIGALKRLKAARDPASNPHPTRPNTLLSQLWATTTAIVREISLPQFFVPVRHLSWLTPPPLGRVLVLLVYWSVIAYFMSWHAVVHDVNFWERIGYRNAWVTLTQLPMIFLLSMKVNIVGFLIGTGHERLNWLHRWVARTMFVTATVHGFHFWTEWVLADFVELEMETMPMVKYGLGAWAILLWNVVIGFVPIRRLAYEVWVLQHVAASIAMLVLVYLHVPTNARFLFWLAVAFLVFDRAARWALLLWQNLRFKTGGSACQGRRRVGHQILARAVADTTTVVTIKDVHFAWTPGQHVYLWIPRLGPPGSTPIHHCLRTQNRRNMLLQQRPAHPAQAQGLLEAHPQLRLQEPGGFSHWLPLRPVWRTPSMGHLRNHGPHRSIYGCELHTAFTRGCRSSRLCWLRQADRGALRSQNIPRNRILRPARAKSRRCPLAKGRHHQHPRRHYKLRPR